jgi:hypothetical protein
MLQVFHAKWYNRLPKSESSEGCNVITKLRGSSFIPHRSEDRLEIKMPMESCGSGMKCRGNGMTSMLKPSLGSKLSFRLVDLTISFTIEHLTILSKLFHCIATCITNGATARNSGATVPTTPTTTSLRIASWNSGMFPIIRVFQFLHFYLF